MQQRCIALDTLLGGLSYISNVTKEVLSSIFVTDVIYDSRKAAKNTVFVCTVGEMHDSHQYAQSVYEKGCRVFVVQYSLDLPEDTVQIKVENGRLALAKISHAFFGNPAEKLMLIGVTGTKGKTTVANLSMSVLNQLGIKTGCIGTNGVTFDGVTRHTGYTTPESYELAKLFDELLQKGAQCVVMEVSSLGVKQCRTAGLTFEVGVFTNLSEDHVGEHEHPTMEDYIACKAAMFHQSKVGLINADDAVSSRMEEACRAAGNQYYTYSLEKNGDVKAWDLAPWQSSNRFGIGFTSNILGGEERYEISQPGVFSVYNALAVLGVVKFVMRAFGHMIQPSAVIDALKNAVVAGRIELLPVLSDATVVIDYAHNELSMESLLTTLRNYQYQRLVVIFGSVGCRSQLRRAQLGHVAAKYADYCIITSDNPDTEDPMQIIDEIAQALAGSKVPYKKFPDRTDAVEFAIKHHQPGDMIVFAGKGHETYQLINGKKVPFSEKEIILRTIKEMQNA